MPAKPTARERFNNYVRTHGGDAAVAADLGCCRSFVFMVRKGKRTPGLSLASLIFDRAKIPAQDWSPVPAAKRVKRSAA